MPDSNQSYELTTAELRRLEYEREQAKRAIDLLCGAAPAKSAIDDMLNASEVMALRHDLVAITERLRELKGKYRDAEKHVPDDDEIAEMFGAFDDSRFYE